MDHIKKQRMWKYVRLRAELSAEEEAHLSGCAECLKLFKACVLAESPEKIEVDGQTRKRPA